jgi:hypothetical protein
MAAGGKPLTWQQTLAVLVCIPILAFAVMAFGQGDDLKPVRNVGRIGLPICVAVFVLLMVSHVRSSRRPDLVPDVLSQVVPIDTIFQVGKSHLFITACQNGRVIVVRALIQNLCDGEGELRMFLRPGSVGAPLLHCTIPGSSVVMAQTMVDPGPIAKPCKLRGYIEGSFRHTGQQVRFGRRTAVTKRVNTGVTVALMFAGHIHAGGGTVLNVDVLPVPEEMALSRDEQRSLNLWQVQSVWTIEDPTTPDEIADQFNAGPEQETST